MYITELFNQQAHAWNSIAFDETQSNAVRSIKEHAFATPGINKYRVAYKGKIVLYKTFINNR